MWRPQRSSTRMWVCATADQTLFWLERSITEGSTIVQYLKVHPGFDFIRSDPRFAGLARRVGLAE